MHKRDYYETLGVPRTATSDEIRRVYRKLAREYHPDLNKSEGAVERFAAISEAYEVLGDEEKRKVYDQFGHAGVHASSAGQGGYGPGSGSGGWGSSNEFRGTDFGSIFEQMFGGGSGSFGATAKPAARQGGTLTHRLSVGFMTALLGGEERVRIAPNSGEAQTISVKIPAGVESGAKLRVQGKGSPGTSGGAAGDLILTIEVGKHPWFRREGLDVLLDVPISLTEAALGTSVTVPLPKGSATLKVPAGSSGGQKLRIKGKGAAGSGGTGDFYAVIRIDAPDTLSDRARELLEALRPELKNPRNAPPWADGEDESRG